MGAGRLNKVIRDVTASYETFEFYKVFQRIYQFCAVDLSSFYLDVLKDRLYAELPEGSERRAAQFVMAQLHTTLARLLAPIMPHTCDEIWDLVPESAGKPASVHLADWPDADPRWEDEARDARWERLIELRNVVMVNLEGLRREKVIGSSQEASLTVATGPQLASWVSPELLTTLCMVSEVEIEAHPGEAADAVTSRRSTHPKCERCWNLRPTVGQDAEHPSLCDRCARVIRAMPAGI